MIKHHEIISKMLKERRNMDKPSVDSKEITFDVEIEGDNLNFIPNSNINYKEKSITKQKMLDRVAAKIKSKSEIKYCPVCNNKLIDRGNGHLVCEKINCCYATKVKPLFKPKIHYVDKHFFVNWD